MSVYFSKKRLRFLVLLIPCFFSFVCYAQEVTTFDTSGTTTFTVPDGVTEIQYLVIAGGGGGGAWRGGGGGAGGLRQGTLPVTPGTVFTVTVGAGGTGAPGGTTNTRGANGQNSVFGSIVAVGGGGGGIGENGNNRGGDGGSGGGEGGAAVTGAQGPGQPQPGQGFAGGNSFNDNSSATTRAGGGGGGAGGVGGNASNGQAGNGGNGIQSAITGTSIYYAGGGGGATTSGADGTGGLGGGGTGNTSGNAQDGEANSGGGGGGAGGGYQSTYTGGAGGSGVVILSYTLDTDGDGVANEDDLDNDNDGILDSDEGSTCNITEAISGVTSELTYYNNINTLYDGVLRGGIFYFGNNQTYPGSPTEIFNISFVEPLVITELKVLLDTDDLTYTQNNSFLGNNVEYEIQGFNGVSWVAISSGISDGKVSGEQEVFDLSANTTAYSNYRILWMNGGLIQWDPWIEEILFKAAPCSETSLDTDNDGVPDYLDLDSDNDGCSDANEYYFSTNADGNLNGGDDLAYGDSSTITVDANGRVDQAAYNGTNYTDVIDANISEACNECNPLPSGNTDTDGDGIADLCDLDSDNDGILDMDEANGSGSAVFDATPQAFWTFDNTTDDSSVNSHNAVAGGTTPPTFSTTDVVEGTHSASFNGTDQEIRYSVDGGFMESAYTQISFSAWIKPDNISGNQIIYEEGGNTNGSALWLNNGLLTYTTRNNFDEDVVSVGPALTVDNKWHHVAATFDNGRLTVYLDGVSNSVTAAYNTVPAHGDPGGIGGTIGGGSSAVDDGVPVSNYSGLMDAARYDNTAAWSLSRIRYEATLLLDTDGDGIPNHLDLDSDNDGIYDVLEAEPGFAGTITAEGRIDINTNEITADGVPTAANAGNGFTPVDTGNDATPNFINLDSDADGCSDANEYYFSTNADGNLNGGDDLAYGDSSTITVDANGRVDQAAYNGTNYTDVIDANISEACNECNPLPSGNTDTDGDGVADLCDLDSDNDGILDMDELENIATSGTATQSSNYTGGGGSANLAIDGNTNGAWSNNSVTHTSNTTPTEYWEVDLGGVNFIPTIIFYNRTDCCSNRISNVYLLVADTPFPADPTDLAGSLANADFTYQFATGESAASVTIPVNQSGRYVRLQKSGDNFSNFLSIAELQVFAADTDGDGISNHLDLDSDNDGCSDANEYYNNLSADGGDGGVYGVGSPTVDADGLVVDAGYNGSGYAAVIDNAASVCEDSDGDGIADSLDLDSDNDGILDEDECGIPTQKVAYPFIGADWTYTVPAGATHLRAKIWGAGGRGDQRNGRGVGGAGGFTEVLIPVSSLTSTSLIVTVGEGGNSTTGSRTYGNGGAGGSDGSRNFGSGGGMSAITYTSLSNPAIVSKADLIAIAGGGGTSPAFTNPGSHAGEGGGLSGGDANSGGASINGLGGDQNSGGGSPPNGNAGDYLLGGNSVLNGGAGGGGYYGGGSGTIASNNEGGGGGGSGYISVTNTVYGQTIRGSIQTPPRNTDPDYVTGMGRGGNSNAGNGGHGLVVIEALFLDCDDDNDGISNYLDTDSDNDGIFDALEADPTFNPTNMNVQGRITGGVDSDGVPSLASGGFTPVDTDSDGIQNFRDLNSDGDACPDVNEYYNNPSADGGDDSIYGSGTPTVDINGLVVGAGYNGTGLANVINNLVSSGCDPYIFEGNTGDVGLGGTWETQANWNFNRLPTAIDTAVVRANSNVTITQEVGALTVDPSYTVSIDTLQRLHIKENLIHNGNVAGQGYLVLDGLSAQEITGTGSFTYLRLDNTNGATLNDNVDLTGVLDLQDGVFTIASTKFLTFKSNATKTAVLSEVAATSDILGCVIVERYIQPNRRAFRYIASAVNTNTACGKASINANLQEGNQVTDYTNYPGTSETPGFGTHITGSTAGNFGFDATQTGNPSMFSWNQNTQGWNAIPNTLDTGANTLDIGNSYALMIRGGRELNLNISNSVTGQDPTTLRFTGELTTGDVVVNNLATGSGNYSFIANPYQAQVDIKELMDSGNVTNVKRETMWIYDPTINLRGGYAAVDLASGNPVPIYSKANKFLQPNQSMFVENTGPSPSLTFIETFKKNLNLEFTNGTFSIDDAARLDITLKRKDNSTFTVADGVRLYFDDSYHNAIQNNDANKLWNSDESLAIKQTDKYLSIERRKYPTSEESVQLSLFNSKSANYQFEFDAQDFDKTAYLKDHYTGNLQEIENDAVSIYTFMANRQIPESVATTRFELVFEETTLGVEDINFEDIRVYPNPASEILHIQIPNATGENYRLRLTDMAGRLIFTESVKAVNGRISTRKIENLQSGVYLINIARDGQDYTKKLIIN